MRRTEIEIQIPAHIRDIGLGVEAERFFKDNGPLGHAQKRLFIANIELSHVLQEISDLVHGLPNQETMEEATIDIEQKVWVRHESDLWLLTDLLWKMALFCTSLDHDWVLTPDNTEHQLSRLPTDIALPVAILNCFKSIGQWILRGRLLALKTIQTAWATSLTEPTLPSNAVHDLEIACESAATLVRIVSALPKDRPNFYWYETQSSASCLLRYLTHR